MTEQEVLKLWRFEGIEYELLAIGEPCDPDPIYGFWATSFHQWNEYFEAKK